MSCAIRIATPSHLPVIRMQRRHPTRQTPPRWGAYLVEFSMVVPVFALFMVGIMEFGHAYMVVATLGAAAKEGARFGGVEGVTTEQVENRVIEILGSAIDTTNVVVLIKDAALFDEDPLATNIDYTTLPEIELNGAEERQLFLVRVEVPYNDVALLPPFWVQNFQLTAMSVMRHE